MDVREHFFLSFIPCDTTSCLINYVQIGFLRVHLHCGIFLLFDKVVWKF